MLHRFGLRFSDLFITFIIALQNQKSNTGKSNTEIKVDKKNSEMKEIEQVRNKEFENAKQSNIFVPSDFYEFIGMPQLQRRKGSQSGCW